MLIAVLLSCVALGHILTIVAVRFTLWPLVSRGWKVHWRRVIIAGAVLGQVLQTGFDLSRVIKVSSERARLLLVGRAAGFEFASEGES